MVLKKKKEGFYFVYGRFLIRSNAKTIPTMAIEAMMAATAGQKYCSVVEAGAVLDGELLRVIHLQRMLFGQKSHNMKQETALAENA